ncbi:MAG: Mrp/NBP35 family ATP-binding protein [Planctomycetes bacterium]|nr:Mrp/NBP35 family ATP-binding protein [Planctomycetota bacterium]
MNESVDAAAVLNALRAVQDPDLHRDIVSLGFVKDVKSCGGTVSFTIELTTPACPVRDIMKEQARRAVMALPGIEKVEINMTSQVRTSLPKQPLLETVRNVVPIASGKGGVGKSTVSANLALALSKMGARVGVMDADVYGPTIPTVLGVKDQPRMLPTQRILPPRAFDIPILSMGFFASAGQAVVVRGPILHKTIEQFLGGVEWGELDYLLVDLPPGTGDVQLSLCQIIPLTGAAVVSTPQDVALNVASKAIDMFRKLRTPVLGVIENMSGYACPKCGHHDDIFGVGGAKASAEQMNIPFLGAIPLDTRIRTSSDGGRPIVVSDPDSPAAKAFMGIAEKLAAQVSIRGFKSDEGILQPVVWGKP